MEFLGELKNHFSKTAHAKWDRIISKSLLSYGINGCRKSNRLDRGIFLLQANRGRNTIRNNPKKAKKKRTERHAIRELDKRTISIDSARLATWKIGRGLKKKVKEVKMAGDSNDWRARDVTSIWADAEGCPDAPHGRRQPAPRTRGGGASYALNGLALQEREDISTCAILATGKCTYHYACLPSMLIVREYCVTHCFFTCVLSSKYKKIHSSLVES